MKTQMMFKIDKKVKDAAMRKARLGGVTLSAVLQSATHAFAEGALKMSLVSREVEEIYQDIRARKNLSPAFKNAKEAIAYLKKRREKHDRCVS